MKKNVVLCIVVLVICTILSACNKQKGESNKSVTEEPKKEANKESEASKDSDDNDEFKSRKASVKLDGYHKMVNICDKSTDYIPEGTSFEFQYDADIDGNDDSIKIESIKLEDQVSESGELVSHVLNINGVKKNISMAGIMQEAWAFTLDGEIIYLAFGGHGILNTPTIFVYQYVNNEIKDFGEIQINCFDEKYFPETNMAKIKNAIDNVKIKDDNSIVGVVESFTIQASHIEVDYKYDEKEKVFMPDVKENVEYDVIEKNDITLKKDLVVFDKAKGTNKITINPQKIKMEKIYVEKVDKTDDASGESIDWCYIKGEKGQEGWLRICNGVLEENGGADQLQLRNLFEGKTLIMYD